MILDTILIRFFLFIYDFPNRFSNQKRSRKPMIHMENIFYFQQTNLFCLKQLLRLILKRISPILTFRRKEKNYVLLFFNLFTKYFFIKYITKYNMINNMQKFDRDIRAIPGKDSETRG